MIDCFWVSVSAVKNILQKRRMSTLRDKSDRHNNSYVFNLISVHYKTLLLHQEQPFVRKQFTVLRSISATGE